MRIENCIQNWFKRIVACVLLLSALRTQAQVAGDTVAVLPPLSDTVFKTEFRERFSTKWHMQPHSPLRATIYSAILPGAGQVYNGNKKNGSVFKKYWKVPVVYAGIATCVYYIDWNTKFYRYHKQQYIYEIDDDISTTSIPVERGNLFWMERHRKWMEVSYFSLVGVYLLQILEANIDAHLFYFDVGNDLSLELHPAIIPAGRMHPGIGLNMRF
jgi:Family of unknown function (DUF5683)